MAVSGKVGAKSSQLKSSFIETILRKITLSPFPTRVERFFYLWRFPMVIYPFAVQITLK